MKRLSFSLRDRSGRPCQSSKIFVIGSGRSGTHWVGYILEAHPDIHVTIEKPQSSNGLPRWRWTPARGTSCCRS